MAELQPWELTEAERNSIMTAVYLRLAGPGSNNTIRIRTAMQEVATAAARKARWTDVAWLEDMAADTGFSAAFRQHTCMLAAFRRKHLKEAGVEPWELEPPEPVTGAEETP